MYTKEFVSGQLREAAKTIEQLTNSLAQANSEKEVLLQKVASLEEGSEADDFALQKKAEDTGFTLRSNDFQVGFGASSEVPQFNSNLTSEERLDMILRGETPPED